MGELKYIPQIPGVKDVHSFWRFFDDKKRVDAFFKTLDDKLAEMNETLETVKTVKDISKLAIQARGDRTMAAEELANACTKAKQIVADVETPLKAREKVLQGDIAALERDKAAFQVKMADDIKEVVAREKIASATSAAAEKLAGTATKASDDADALKTRYAAALEAVKVGVAAV